jgi:hypothetical protein
LTAKFKRNPAVSVVLVVYNMAREAPRTLYSLSANYQRNIHPDDYEVIVVDNGSNPPLQAKAMAGLAGNFRLVRIDDAAPSPAAAVNRGLAEARGDVVGVMIDGARIVTPGLLHFARHGASLYDKAVVATLGWYLGYDFQGFAIQGGYDQAREDALLESINWPNDGYRLFEISTLDSSSMDGWFQPISESNALFIRREWWELLGGLDERFDAPGGGLVNLDTFRRVIEWPGAELVIPLGEGAFHQLHGGTSTNALPENQVVEFNGWLTKYSSIRGRSYDIPRPTHPPTFIGILPRPVLARMVRAATVPSSRHFEQPLGAGFNKELWTFTHACSANQSVAGLVELAQNEFRHGRFESACAVARLIRERAPEEPESQRMLSLLAPWLTVLGPPKSQLAEYHLALAEAHRLLGEMELAVSGYRTALTFDRNLVQAHIGLATVQMPGDFYYAWLDRFYTATAPETVIEIGVFDGASLARVRPPTLAIGVDPNPNVSHPLTAETHIFPETSDAFFARHGPDALLAGHPLGIGFIDGLRLYEQALKDFINLERYCGPRSVILFHNTIPLDEATQDRARETQFHTGDVWKTVLCLKHYRPDLDIFTIPTPWTGLTVVTGLDPTSRVLADRYEEAVAQFIDTPFSAVESNRESALNIIPNNWIIVQTRLQKRRIL